MAVMRRQDSMKEEKNQRSGRSFYTSYSEMNELLNRFVKEAEDSGIWVSVEAVDLRENRMGQSLCELVRMALDTAKENCIETTPPRGRYIKIRSREMQQQMLIRIEFSCEDRMIREFDKSIVRMRELIETADGYLKIQLIDDTGNIKIAIPDEAR
ncbi:hypothetical protein NE634_04840 [Lacrimispora saccharolytica]|nr:hypothetical protein [Lacrimispora saccharolytica]